jgi:hypothetical protein
MGLIVTFPHLDFLDPTLGLSLLLLLLLSLVKSSLLSAFVQIIVHSHVLCHTLLLSGIPQLLRRNTLRRCRSTKATPRIQVGQTSSRNITISNDKANEMLHKCRRREWWNLLVAYFAYIPVDRCTVGLG